jgi:hypothetical protein
MNFISKVIVRLRRKQLDRACKDRLMALSCWPVLEAYIKSTNSTGCSYIDYWYLFDTVRRLRPKEVLECGTGVTSVVMGLALMENAREHGISGRLTSMEDKHEWHSLAVKLLPEVLHDYIDLRQSDKCEYSYSLFRGVGYKDVPDRPYTIVFVDGPGTIAPSDGTRTFDFDYINVVKRSDQPVLGIVDARLSTCFVYQVLFGKSRVRYDAVRDLGIIGPCSRNDLHQPKKSSSSAFTGGIKVFGRTEFKMDIEREMRK